MKVVELSGGVGGARMARGLAAAPGVELTVVVNVGDDDENHGLAVSPDIDTVVYTLAGVEGPRGWGRAGDTFRMNDELARFGLDNTFRLGDLDLALKLYRTRRLGLGDPLSSITAEAARAFGVEQKVLPASDDELRTEVRTAEAGWVSFQDYFVRRECRDEVTELRFAAGASPAPGVIDAVRASDLVVIGPSNPPLSIWPILAVEPVRAAVAEHRAVVAVSPLFGGKPLKGPADRVMASLGLPPGNRGVAKAYDGLIDALVVDSGDADGARLVEGPEVVVADTRIGDAEAGRRLAEAILRL